MPLNDSCSLTAYKENISELVRSGRTKSQAVAIAIRTLKRACGVKSDEKMSPRSIVGESKVGRNLMLKEMGRKMASLGGEYVPSDMDSYYRFDDVLDSINERRISIRPESEQVQIIREFERQNSKDESKDTQGFWEGIAKQCTTVAECMKVYLAAIENQVPGVDDPLQKRAVFLANREQWE